MANLGKEPELDERTARKWEEIADLLEGCEPSAEQLQLGVTSKSVLGIVRSGRK